MRFMSIVTSAQTPTPPTPELLAAMHTLAEELTQDALVAALERWPASGVPERPGAWLMATARRRAVDHLRRDLQSVVIERATQAV
jgi:predicted RNA polymerase sigma factor